MKTLLTALLVSLAGLNAFSATSKKWSFSYTDRSKTVIKQPLKVTIAAQDQETAYKMAAKECFSQLTKGQYPGEEKGLDIIDICANPKM